MSTFLLVCACAALFSCGGNYYVRRIADDKIDIFIQSAPDANLNNPVALDIMLVFHDDLERQLMQMTAAQWREQKAQVKRDFREDYHFVIRELELVPGAPAPDETLPLTRTAKSVILFAGYVTPGEHRVRVQTNQDLQIRLLEKKFTVELLSEGSR